MLVWLPYQSEFGEDRVLPQWVVSYILKHRINILYTMDFPSIGRFSHTWPTKYETDGDNRDIQETATTHPYLSHLIPVSMRASPTRKSTLISAAIILLLWALVKKHRAASLFESTSSHCVRPFCARLYLFWLTFKRVSLNVLICNDIAKDSTRLKHLGKHTMEWNSENKA